MSYKVGLTGGIGSGKTAVSTHFARLGVSVIDTDLLARDLVEPGQAALREIVAGFGDVLTADGRLDRGKLRNIVFNAPDQRRKLEAILHPAIRQAALRRSEQATSPYCLIVVPLLFETDFDALLDRVLVVDIPEAEQRKRVMARDGLDPDTINKIIAAQFDRQTRLERADDVLDNTVSPEQRDAAVERLHQQYLNLAREKMLGAQPTP